MNRFKILTFACFCCWFCESASATPSNQISFESRLMGQERILSVRLPRDYEKYPNNRYPVVYQLQSSDTFFAALAAIESLAAAGQMPDVVLVGIEHDDKFSELSIDSLRSVTFYKHLIEEVRPFIENKYRTEKFSILSGWSVGGGFVIHKMMNSAPFDGFFAYSPSLTFELNNKSYEKSLDALVTNNDFLILTLGNEQGEFLSSFQVLTASTIKYSSNIQSKIHGAFDHRGNAYISQYFGFKALFADWTPSETLTQSGLPTLKKHYHNLSIKYGFAVDIPKEILLFSSYSVLAGESEKHLEKGIELVAYTLARHPETKTEFNEMAAFFYSQKSMASHEALLALLQSE